MRRDILEDKKVICPQCKGCGKMSIRDKDSEIYKIKTYQCEVCNGKGIVIRRVIIDYISLEYIGEKYGNSI